MGIKPLIAKCSSSLKEGEIISSCVPCEAAAFEQSFQNVEMQERDFQKKRGGVNSWEVENQCVCVFYLTVKLLRMQVVWGLILENFKPHNQFGPDPYVDEKGGGLFV